MPSSDRRCEIADLSGKRHIAYREWGAPDNPNILVCAHGLTRNSRDFDALSNVLHKDYRIICMDVAGRGDSDWLNRPDDYSYPLYVSDAHILLTHAGCRGCDWLGTSMGGVIGMMLAAEKPSPIRRLIVNDIGPIIPNSALRRIAKYLEFRPAFTSFQQFETYLRQVHAPFGPLTNEQWHHLAIHSSRQTGTGHWDFKYDPAIAIPFARLTDDDIDLRSIWDAISCPVLMLHGRESDILTGDIVAQAQAHGPGLTVHHFDGVGHAPALMEIDQIQCIQNWLAG